jgi:ribonucleotide monophosphatase NagD (HAD superfamily)
MGSQQRPGRSLVDRLNRLGFQVAEADLFTSLSATQALVEQRYLSPLLLLSDSAMEEFADLPTSDTKDSVVVGLAPERLSYEHMNAAFHILNRETDTKAQLLATHRANYYRDTKGELSLGPGPFVAALERAARVEAIVCGKPSEAFVKLCLDSLATDGISSEDWSDVAMVRRATAR